jgi:hypothetical protein
MTRDVGIAALGAVMAALPNPSDLDDAAFRAFDIAVDDAEALRTLMNTLSDREQLDQAMQMVHPLLEAPVARAAGAFVYGHWRALMLDTPAA